MAEGLSKSDLKENINEVEKSDKGFIAKKFNHSNFYLHYYR